MNESLYTELRKDYLRTWRIWYSLNQRCDPNWFAKYHSQGTVVFEICDEWSIKESGTNGFINFFDDVGDLNGVQTLYRHDTLKPYSKANCRQGTCDDRAKRSQVYLGSTSTTRRIAEANGIPAWKYYRRLRWGWSLKDASTVPHKKHEREVNYNVV